MARDDLHFRLRIPEGLKQQVEEAAAQNHRSMTAEIIARLQSSFDEDVEHISSNEQMVTMIGSIVQSAIEKTFSEVQGRHLGKLVRPDFVFDYLDKSNGKMRKAVIEVKHRGIDIDAAIQQLYQYGVDNENVDLGILLIGKWHCIINFHTLNEESEFPSPDLQDFVLRIKNMEDEMEESDQIKVVNVKVAPDYIVGPANALSKHGSNTRTKAESSVSSERRRAIRTRALNSKDPETPDR